MEIICRFQKSNIGDLQLRNWKSRAQQYFRTATKKPLGKEELKLVWKNQLDGLKELYLGSKKMFLLLNLDLPYLRYQNIYFDIISADVVYPPSEKLSLFIHFCFNLDVHNVEQPDQT